MRLKITILTILVGFLVVLSFYLVGYAQPKDRDSQTTSGLGNFKQSNFGIGKFSSQTGYILPISEPTYFPLRNPQVPPPEVKAKSFLLYDTRNGKVIFSRDPQKSLPIASLTKILTAAVALGNLSLDEAVKIEPESFNVDGKGADFNRGEVFYFKDILKAMLIKSSNDAAAAIAKTVERKSGIDFVELMNKKAAEIGMSNSYFLDPAGLSDGARSSVEDLLKLVKYSKRYSQIWTALGTQSADISSADGRFSHRLTSTNRLFDILPGIVGGKTGYTDGALGCIIVEERLSQVQSSLVLIILGSSDRFEDAKTLLMWAKIAFRWE